ncbi:MAG: hypothetical protein ACFCUX_08695, partial [Candidatus Methylacidiphilales bacterium]
REKLMALRPRLLAGEFDAYYKITGNCLHVEAMDREAGKVSGYECPPAKAITKLYNFNAIDCWDHVPNERLHEGHQVFKPGYDDNTRLHFWQQHGWAETPMRCLHLCFQPRSPVDNQRASSRANISDRAAAKNKKNGWWARLIPQRSGDAVSPWKENQYRKGSLINRELRDFL